MYRLMIFLVVVPLILCACAQLAGPCSSSMLEGFMAIEEGGLNLATQSRLLVNLEADLSGMSFEEGEWVISKKNTSGCTVSYRYKLNGQSVTAPIFYVDVKSRSVYPDDEMARTMSLVLGEVAPWGPIPDGISSLSDSSIGIPTFTLDESYAINIASSLPVFNSYWNYSVLEFSNVMSSGFGDIVSILATTGVPISELEDLPKSGDAEEIMDAIEALVPLAEQISKDGYEILALINQAEPPFSVRLHHESLTNCIAWQIEGANAVLDAIKLGISTDVGPEECRHLESAVNALEEFIVEELPPHIQIPTPPSRPTITARPIVTPTMPPSLTPDTSNIRSPEATITPDAAGSQLVVINGIVGAGDLETESVRLLNTGAEISMAGWTLDDGEGNSYNFPDFTFYSTGAVDVHSISGSNTTIDLYWGLDLAVWTQGKVIYLRNASGDLVSSFIVTEN